MHADLEAMLAEFGPGWSNPDGYPVRDAALAIAALCAELDHKRTLLEKFRHGEKPEEKA